MKWIDNGHKPLPGTVVKLVRREAINTGKKNIAINNGWIFPYER